jgi:hypothetical protein
MQGASEPGRTYTDHQGVYQLVRTSIADHSLPLFRWCPDFRATRHFAGSGHRLISSNLPTDVTRTLSKTRSGGECRRIPTEIRFFHRLIVK